MRVARNRASRNLAAVAQEHRHCAILVRDDAFDAGTGEDLRTVSARRVGERLRHRAHTAANERPRSLNAEHAPRQMMREHVARTGVARPEIGPDEPVVDEFGGQDRRPHVSLDEVGRRAEQQRLRIRVESLEAGIRIRERIEERAPRTFDAFAVRFEARDVGGVERSDLASVGGGVAAEQQRASVFERRERVGILAIEVQAAPAQIEGVDQPWIEQAAHV